MSKGEGRGGKGGEEIIGDGGGRDGSGVRVDNKPFQCYK